MPAVTGAKLSAARAETRRWSRPVAAAAALAFVLGLFGEYPVAYLLVTASVALPGLVWLRAGAAGIPILPLLGVVYYFYFGLPIVRGNFPDFATWAEVLRVAATVATFMVAATVPGWFMMRRLRPAGAADLQLASSAQVVRLILAGLMVGVAFHAAIISGGFAWLGSAFGVARAIMQAAIAVACFLLGHACAAGFLRGKLRLIAFMLFAALIMLELSTLFLVSAMLSTLAVIFGYVLTSRRIPWLIIAAALLLFSVLHAGKAEMRDNYWYAQLTLNPSYSIFQAPVRVAKWVETGIRSVGPDTAGQNVLDRASLFRMLLRVQRLAPDYVPYLDGASYALLPNMLVPRFLDPDKIASQASMTMLNVHFGFQTYATAAFTAIGFGIIPEAYANFGYLGVIGMGLLYGILCWYFTRLSAGASAVSLRGLLAIAATAVILNVEKDLSFLLTTLWQALAATLIFFVGARFLIGGEKRLAAPDLVAGSPRR